MSLKWLNLLNPLYSAWGNTDIASELPVLNNNPRANLALWNLIISGSAAAGTTALVKLLANETHKEHWARKRDKALTSKLNGVVTQIDPKDKLNIDSVALREKQRNAGIETPALLENSDEDIEKQANDPSDTPAGVRLLQDALAGIIPVAGTAGMAYLTSKAIDKHTKDTAEQELDEQINAYEEELTALQARMLKLQTKGTNAAPTMQSNKSDDLYKYASQRSLFDDVTDKLRNIGGLTGTEVTDGKKPLGDILKEYPFLSAMLLATPVAVGAYQFFNKRDEDVKKYKIMEELASTNLTNIAPRLELALDADGNPVVKDAEI